MNRQKWSQLSERAFKKKVESEQLLEQAVQALMTDKGFSKEAVSCFSACYAGGNETVINFCCEGEFADLDIKEAADMSKEQIIRRLQPHLSSMSLELLKRYGED